VATKRKGSAPKGKHAAARPQAGARGSAKSKPAPKMVAKVAKPGVGGQATLKPRIPAKGSPRTRSGMQGTLDFESNHTMGTYGSEHAMPPAPARRRSTAKPGSPDWPGESLTVGMIAPEFALPSTLGRRVTLSEFRGKRVILYFYPKDDTPGCTMEACAFRDHLPRIESKDAVVLGVSLDDELSHQRFAQKYNLPFPLLSDVDAAVSRQYGTYKEKNLYGRSYWGIERTTFVIDREGRVENVFRRVKVEGHAEEVMATLAV
jgi:peroxiredoxin Q/BCP